ncbi:MAG: hypothetical protein N3B15_08540 [Planctomycetota bacterium]|nr:hypothetical protein [Planctomycetota bacterium]
MTTRFVVLSLGGQHEQTVRAWMALLSLLAWSPADRELVLITDQPQRYRWFGERLRLYPVEQATVTAWQGPQRFFWRVKLMAMQTAADLGPARLIYVDTDTLARQPLATLCEALDAGAVFMHCYEFDVARSRRRGDRRLWRQLRGLLPPPCPMWNAGVVALGRERRALLDQALALCDRLLLAGVQHTLTEQLATSVTLAATGRLQAAAPWIDHYWGNKDGYAAASDRWLAEVLIDGASIDEAVQRLRAQPIRLPCVVRRRRWQQWAARLLGLAAAPPS